MEEYKTYIAKQVLANSIEITEKLDGDINELDFENFKLKVSIVKA